MMNASDSKRLFLKLFIGFLSLSALIAIASVLNGDFGEIQLKILATCFIISAASICSMSCAAFIEKRKQRGLGTAGMLFSALSAALLTLGIWAEISDEIYWKLTITSIVITVATAHAFLLKLPTLTSQHRWVQKTADALIAILAAQIIVAAWGEIDNEGYYRLVAVLAILLVLLTLLIPILLKIGTSQRDRQLVLTELENGEFRDTHGSLYHVEKLSDTPEA
ncbi:hypothetical protein [Rubritalea marina]|uniref:hypothetical protein n=1 Tax=Rubritalea marina TaxID=361055 RepID=UPI00036A06CB|nr:hypothetical protein [Rubritalea marina]